MPLMKSPNEKPRAGSERGAREEEPAVNKLDGEDSAEPGRRQAAPGSPEPDPLPPNGAEVEFVPAEDPIEVADKRNTKRPVGERMMELFAGFPDAYGTHGVPTQKGDKWEIKSTAQTIRKPVTLKLWNDHLAGVSPLGIIPIRADGTCVWGSIDVDDYERDLLGLIATAERLGLPLAPGRSKSGGLHLFMFLKRPVPAEMLQKALKYLAVQLGVGGAEIFPKQTDIVVERGDVGNWMVMPYFGGTYDGKIREQVGLRKTGAELTAEEFCDAAEAAKVDPAELTRMAEAARSGPRKKKTQPKDRGSVDFDFDELQRAVMSLPIHEFAGYNSWLVVGMGIHHATGGSEAGLQLFDNWSAGDREKYNAAVVQEKWRSFQGGRANSITAATIFHLARERGWRSELAPWMVIDQILQENTKPPRYVVTVEDKKVTVSSMKELYDFNKFCPIAMTVVKHAFRPETKVGWANKLHEAMTTRFEERDVPIDVTGVFDELFEEFLTNRQRGKNREDILVGRPWEDEGAGVRWFRLRDLQKFLRREGYEDCTRAHLMDMLRERRGKALQLKVKGRPIDCWRVPSVERRPDLDIPGDSCSRGGDLVGREL